MPDFSTIMHLEDTFDLKSSLYSRYYAEACNEQRGHIRDLAPGQHSHEEISQRWRAVGDTGDGEPMAMATMASRWRIPVILFSLNLS